VRTAVNMPHYADDAIDGRIVEWRKAVGDRVARGEPIAEIETDKATMDLDAPVSGTLAEIVHGEDAVVAIGEPIAWIDSD
jgi:pyruvate/2-oxoglutarate dehydrogenase complex dihydrolipoamide acyltransferase (E2) component